MNKEMTIRKIPVSDINPAKYNPRKDLKPGDPAYEKLKRSMTEFGYAREVLGIPTDSQNLPKGD